jgi:hypothetical protein
MRDDIARLRDDGLPGPREPDHEMVSRHYVVEPAELLAALHIAAGSSCVLSVTDGRLVIETVSTAGG